MVRLVEKKANGNCFSGSSCHLVAMGAAHPSFRSFKNPCTQKAIAGCLKPAGKKKGRGGLPRWGRRTPNLFIWDPTLQLCRQHEERLVQCPEADGVRNRYVLILVNTVGGRNPAPSKKPSNDDSFAWIQSGSYPLNIR